ncbi:MAG: radical SAM protein [Anaerolineae bacterium]|nr:radical SAM protein [Anaerolineae bacterium]
MKVHVVHRPTQNLFTRPSGFIKAFDYTLNPFSGCAFGCSYCYAAFFAPSDELQESWGEWVRVKENALELLRKKRARPLIDKSIYMSSVTDPYQPIEKQLELTRSLLIELLEYHQARLVIQTRSLLVTRDIDLLRQFKYVRVNMTVTTDDDEVRRAFEPLCPSNQRRLDAVKQLTDAGISACITMTPLLPVRDPLAFAQQVKDSGATRFVVQHFHENNRRFVAGTGQAALDLCRERNWTEATYRVVVKQMRTVLPVLYEGQPGFAPVWE